MNYTKPEITALASASSVIQNISKSEAAPQDYKNVDFTTLNAYQADE
jgi:hypothetical protein